MASSAPRVEPLEWDSSFLGLRVGRVVAADDAAALAGALRVGGEAAFDLLYWATPQELAPGQAPSGYELGYTDRRVLYAAELAVAEAQGLLDVLGSVQVAELPAGAAPESLLALAPIAGGHSRFRRDPRIPEERFLALYRTWLSRSAARELADTVLVAAGRAGPLGFATGALASEQGEIGLVAVSDAARGEGVGSALVGAVGRFLLSRGARVSTVVTQQENLAACRLYEKAGYSARSRSCLHHLWRVGEPR